MAGQAVSTPAKLLTKGMLIITVEIKDYTQNRTSGPPLYFPASFTTTTRSPATFFIVCTIPDGQ